VAVIPDFIEFRREAFHPSDAPPEALSSSPAVLPDALKQESVGIDAC
jgi:hypothetical protein